MLGIFVLFIKLLWGKKRSMMITRLFCCIYDIGCADDFVIKTDPHNDNDGRFFRRNKEKKIRLLTERTFSGISTCTL